MKSNPFILCLLLIALGRGSAAGIVETHLRILKEMAEGSRPLPEESRRAARRS